MGNHLMVGGQAVIEGVMMRGPKLTATAVRDPNGQIQVETKDVNSISDRYPILKKPLLRGTVSLIESLVIGIRSLSYSAKMAGEEDEQLSDREMAGTIVFALVLASILFIAIPTGAARLFHFITEDPFFLNLMEGFLRLAIFLGFIVSMLLFVKVDHQLQGILLGASIIVVLGVVDDMSPLRAYFKFCVQIFAALVAVFHGVVIQTLSNPNVFAESPYWDLGWLSIPVTIIWIVAITNAVNFIDGLDGLAVGVSAISTASLIVVALMVKEVNIAVILCALFGACLGFIPYNMNPAKIFMGDTGSTFLGYILATLSITGLFKMYAIISFAVPFLILGIPIFDISFAFLRRIAHGQNPMKADRGHFHHRLIDMGFSQKQAVAIAYMLTGILGLAAVLLTSSGELKALILIAAIFIVSAIGFRLIFSKNDPAEDASSPEPEEKQEEPHE